MPSKRVSLTCAWPVTGTAASFWLCSSGQKDLEHSRPDNSALSRGLNLGHPAGLGLGHAFVARADRGALLVDVGIVQIGARQGVGHGFGRDRTGSENKGRQSQADMR